MKTQRTTTAAAALLGVLLALAGCSLGSDEEAATPKASPSATPGATAASVTKLIQAGITQAQTQDMTSAETTFTNALVLDPGNKFALFNLGLIAQTRGQAKAASAYYKEALATDPAYTPAMYNQAILLEATDLQAAATLYERIVAINPKASTAFLRLGFVYDALNRTKEAQTARATALRLDPSLASVKVPELG